MNKKIIVAGHICLDITLAFGNENVENIGDILSPGKLLQMKNINIHTGGAVANTGLALKILGADVSLMGKVGNDELGNILIEKLNAYNASKGMLKVDGEDTSCAIVLAFQGIDRIFLCNSGANNTYQLSDIPEQELEDALIFHLGYPPLMKRMYENEGEELLKIMKHMKNRGIVTSLDMASVDSESEAAYANWTNILKKVLPYVDFFVPSVEELCYMLDKERFYEWKKRAAGKDVTQIIDIEKDVKPLAEQCMRYGPKVLLIKCGAQGLYYQTTNYILFKDIAEKLEFNVELWADKQGFEKSYVPDRILSGTGAGDTSIAAFLKAVMDGYSLEKSVQLAAATGASCVETYDALGGLKSFEELEAKIEAGWKKNN